jgi:hypothetical protein
MLLRIPSQYSTSRWQPLSLRKDQDALEVGVGAINRAATWRQNVWEGAGDKVKHRQALIAHIDKLEPITQKVDSGAYTDEHRAFSVSGRTFGTIIAGSEQLYRDMVLADNPLDVGVSSQHLGTPYLKMVQYVPLTCVPIGTMTLNPRNNVNRDDDEPLEPDTLNTVFASLDSHGGVIPRAWRGRLVPKSLIAYLPGATSEAVRAWLNQRHAVLDVCPCETANCDICLLIYQMMCSLYFMGVYSYTEFH